MTDSTDRPTRRRVLDAVVGAATVAASGCLRFATSGETTETAAGGGAGSGAVTPRNARFSFAYDGRAATLTVRYDGGGGDIVAGRIQFRGIDGASARWHELGSTAAGERSVLQTGAEAVLGPDVLNWETGIPPGETVRLVYRTGDSPVTIARYQTKGGATDTPASGDGTDTAVPTTTEGSAGSATDQPETAADQATPTDQPETTTDEPTPTPTPGDGPSGIAPGFAGAWPSYRHDGGNTGHASDADGPASLSPRWTVETGNRVISSPAVVDGTLYVGNNGGTLHAIAESDGSIQWTYRATAGILASPTVANGVAYVGDYGGVVHAVDVTDGTAIWTTSFGGQLGSPLVGVDAVYASGGGDDSKVYAFSRADGEQLWSYDTGAGYVPADPALESGTLVVSDGGGTVHGIDTTTGQKQWTASGGGRPAVAGETAYAITRYGSAIRAFSVADGSRQWSYRTADSPSWAVPTVTDDLVIAGDQSGTLYGIDRADGTKTWTAIEADSQLAGAASDGSRAYVGTEGGQFYAVNTGNGDVLAEFAAGSRIGAPPSIANGSVYVGTFDGQVYALTDA